MKLGIRIATVKPEKPAMALPAFGLAEVYCIETGETVEGVSIVSIEYSAGGVITAQLHVFPVEIEGSERPLFQNMPIPQRYEPITPGLNLNRDDRKDT
jgi:hypothetical protein